MQLIKDIFPKTADPPRVTYPEQFDYLRSKVKETNLIFHED